MTRDEVKMWLVSQTTSIENIDVEKQSMIGEDVIDLMYSLVKNNVVLGDVIASDFLTKRKFSLTNSLRAFFKKNPNTWKRGDGSHFKYGAAMQYGYDLAVRRLKKSSL